MVAKEDRADNEAAAFSPELRRTSAVLFGYIVLQIEKSGGTCQYMSVFGYWSPNVIKFH